MKKLIVIVVAIVALIIIIGMKEEPSYLTYLTSSAKPTDYCNGVKMDSAGYAKTITQLKTSHIEKGTLSQQQLLNKTVSLASGPNNLVISNYKKQNKPLITFYDGTASIGPIDGWAGVSIFMCSWKPLVEANLKKYPFVKHIIWQSFSH